MIDRLTPEEKKEMFVVEEPTSGESEKERTVVSSNPLLSGLNAMPSDSQPKSLQTLALNLAEARQTVVS